MLHTSQPESCSILDISPRSQVSQPFFTLQPITTSLDFEIYANKWQQKEPVYETSRVLLFKGIPEDIVEPELLTVCQPFGLIKDVFFKKSKRYAFLQFERLEQAQKCYESFTMLAPIIRGNALKVFYTGKDTLVKPDNTTSQASRFILLTFNKNASNIDSSLIMQLLGNYGRCLKIAIFQLKTTQVFVEMEDVLQAIHTREALDGQMVFNFISLRIFYTEEKAVFQQAKPSSSMQLQASTAGTLDNLSWAPHAASVNKSCSQIWNDHTTASSCVWPNNMNVKKMSSLPAKIPLYEQPVKSFSVNQDFEFRVPKQNVQQNYSTANSVPPVFHTKEKKSETILLVRNLPQGITAKMLFLLFGMYGNVLKVKIFFKNPENALIELQTPEQAELAKSHLNNCPIHGGNIFVANSKQGVFIDTSSLKKGEETQYMGDYNNSPEHRYKFSGSKNHLNIVPPSKVIHLSNLCEDKEEDFYMELFRGYGTIQKFMFLKGTEKMALMELSSVDDTVRILMNFHNLNIFGKYLKVSFSKYQKVKDF